VLSMISNAWHGLTGYRACRACLGTFFCSACYQTHQSEGLLFNICRKQHEFLRIEESHEGKWDTPLQWKQSCESKRTDWLEELRKKWDVEMKDCACVEKILR
jgi:hypothetical protein